MADNLSIEQEDTVLKAEESDVGSEPKQLDRRELFGLMHKWSKVVIVGVVAGLAIDGLQEEAEAGVWVNRRGSWGNGGGGGWINRHGGGGWVNRGGGGWVNRRGGGSWINRR
jgi:hypothetical protein